MSAQSVLEVLARAVALFGGGRRPAQQAVDGSRVAGEAPLREEVGVRLERGVELRCAVPASSSRAAASASDAREASQNMVRGTALTPPASAAS